MFCDEGVFRIVLDILLQKNDEFCNIFPMLGGFLTAKYVEHCTDWEVNPRILYTGKPQTDTGIWC